MPEHEGKYKLGFETLCLVEKDELDDQRFSGRAPGYKVDAKHQFYEHSKVATSVISPVEERIPGVRQRPGAEIADVYR